MELRLRPRTHTRGITTALALACALAAIGASAPAAHASAGLTMEPFAGGPLTNDTTPAFSGTSEDPFDIVTVDIYVGAEATGEVVRSPSSAAPGPGHTWSATVFTPLTDGTYTALAKQTEIGGLGETRESAPYTFTVDTRPPTVTLDPPAHRRSSDSTPSFSGTASDTTVVTVSVYAGASAKGSAVATLKSQGTGAGWASASLASPLADGEYTAVARQPSSIGNAEGVSAPVTFEVDTKPPQVTLDAPPALSNDTTPSFSGSASEGTPVSVEIYEGSHAEGDVVRVATAEGTHGKWTSEEVAPALPGGRHTFTAVAVQASEIGNPAGHSEPVTFVLDTKPPDVTIKRPVSPSNDETPLFSGASSETTPVTVEVFSGTKAEGSVVASASAVPGAGTWTTAPASPALPEGTYTALAIEASAIENPLGKSEPVTFQVVTKPPTVTLNALPTPSANASPAFSGTASDVGAVTVDVYRGALPEGVPVASAVAEVIAGEWVAPPVTPKLEWGEYTAVASQPSSIGNPPGTSKAFTFKVESIAPLVATEAASGITPTAAVLYASVNPRGAPVSECEFEYGLTTAYGTKLACGFVSEVSEFAATGTTPVPVFARIYALAPNTTYHFRIAATGEGGTAYGADEMLHTLSAPSFGEEGAPGSSTASGVAAAAASRIAAAIAKAVSPRGHAARIGSLLAPGSITVRLRAPASGRALISWYYAPRAKPGSKTAVRPIRIATGAATMRKGRTSAVRIVLTAAGRRVLRSATHIAVTVRCTFTAPGSKAASATAALTLKR